MEHSYNKRYWAAGVILFAAACSGRHTEVVSTRTVNIQEPPIAAPAMIDISIVDLHDVPSTDPSQERVVGTIVNKGDKPVSRISIRVEALDRAGNVVSTVVTPPLTQTVDPFGGRATFEASMPQNAAVAGYHAVALAR